jgi:hypothetical protein
MEPETQIVQKFMTKEFLVEDLGGKLAKSAFSISPFLHQI